MITLEAFYWRKPVASHFLIFGTTVYFHVSKDIKNKIEFATKIGVFVGHKQKPHNYRVYLSSPRVILMRKDVKFHEEKAMICCLE